MHTHTETVSTAQAPVLRVRVRLWIVDIATTIVTAIVRVPVRPSFAI